LLGHKLSVAQRPPPVPDLGRSHVAFRKEITTQAVGNLAGIDLVILPLRRGNTTQHQRVCHSHLFSVREQVIVDPTGENRSLHRHHPELG
jgi:hypothetical protein